MPYVARYEVERENAAIAVVETTNPYDTRCMAKRTVLREFDRTAWVDDVEWTVQPLDTDEDEEVVSRWKVALVDRRQEVEA